MNEFNRPKVVISRCIEFDNCRYNGEMIPNKIVRALKKHMEFIPVCPEVEIGLGIPRHAIRITKERDEYRLFQPATGDEHTEKMNEFTDRYLKDLKDVDGFILKSRSPSCGLWDAKIYPPGEKVGVIGKGPGFFGKGVLETHEELALDDEARLNNQVILEHFLTKLFCIASFNNVKRSKKMNALVEFQTQNKYLLMAYNQKELRLMGKIVANHDKKPITAVISEYEAHLLRALAKPPRFTSIINVLQHLLGYFSDKLEVEERSFFLELIEEYRDERVPLGSLITIIRSWVVRFGQEYLEQQTFLEPYPHELISIPSDGRWRSYWK